jgi:hypothetical protein
MRTLWLTLCADYLTQLPQNCKKGRLARLARSLRKRGTEAVRMKKGLITLVCLIALMVTAVPAGAQTRYRRYDQRYDQRVYSGRRYDRNWDNRSVWDKHRDKITTAAGAGAGALLGGIIGGKKGAIIGAIAGGGGAALYTYKIRDNRDDRYRYRNRRY